jgi:hypothetical protein
MADEILKPGDLVVIKGHHIYVEGIRCWVAEFKAKVVKDLGLDRMKRHVIEVANLNGQRAIERQYIKIDRPVPIKDKKEPIYVDIKCVECGGRRQVRQCDARQITRCELCQKQNNRTKAKARYQEKKKVPNEVK